MKKKFKYIMVAIAVAISLGTIVSVGYLAWRSRKKANLWTESQTAFRHRNFEQAHRLLRELLNADPANEDACRLLAEISEEQQRYANAVYWWRRVAALNALDPLPPERCAENLLNAGDAAQARTLLASTCEKNNGSPKAQLLWVDALAQSGDLIRARQAWKKLSAAEQKSARGRLVDALMLLRERDLPPAKQIFHETLQAVPQADFHWRARIGLFNIALMGDQLPTAEQELLAAYQLNPTRTAPILADFFLAQNNTAKGIGYLQNLIKLAPENFAARIRLAELYAAERQLAPIRELQKTLNPSNKAQLESSYYLEAMSLFLEQKYPEASEKLLFCPIYNDRVVYALIRLISDIELGRPEKWEEDARRLLRQADTAASRERLGNILFPALLQIAGKPEQLRYARSTAQLLAEILPRQSPLRPPVLRFLMLDALRGGNNQEARNYAGELLDCSPNDANAFLVLGEIALNNQLPQEALRYFAKLPRDRNGLLGRGTALEQLNRFPEAAAIYQEAYRQVPGDLMIFNAYGNFLLRRQAYAEIDRLAAGLPDTPPENRYAKAMLLTESAEAQKRPEAAIRQRDLAIAALLAMPADVERDYQLGYLYARQDRNVEAEQFYTQVLKADPNRLFALLNLSEVKAALGKKDEALALAQQARSTYPALPAVQECWKRRMAEKER